MVCPRDEEDVLGVVSVASNFNVPITARGGGTSTAGQAIGSGIVLDFSKYCHKILDVGASTVTTQPGIVLEHLNKALADRMFAPDPSSRSWCTVGGMIGNNASGPRSFHYGSTRNHVQDLKLILADGRVCWASELSQFFGGLVQEVKESADAVQKVVPKTVKNSSGYAFDQLLQSNFAAFLTGSEGTLAIVTQAKIRTVPKIQKRTTVVLAFESMNEAITAVDGLRMQNPYAIELVDHVILRALKSVDETFAQEIGIAKAEASLWVEFESQPLNANDWGAAVIIGDEDKQEHLWTLRSVASKALHAKRSSRRPLRCIEDAAVPPANLNAYVSELREILKRHDCDGAVFGHAGDAHIHVNPSIDVQAGSLNHRVEKLMDDVYDLVLKLGGTISGEHGDGLLRKNYMHRQWNNVLPLFAKVKEAFDPKDIFNPGKKQPDNTFTFPEFRDFTEYESSPKCLLRSC